MKTPQYITQITKEWLERVSRRIDQGLFIKIREMNDSVAIDVDIDKLRQEIGGGGSGSVQTVDGKSPDADGAVSFDLTAGRLVKTDANGHLVSHGSMAGSKWMKTDASGMPSTTNDTPATLGDTAPSDVSKSTSAAGSAETAARSDHIHKLPTTVITTTDIAKGRLTSLGKGASGTVTYVSGVYWDGTTLFFKTKTLTVENGVIINIGTSEASTTIDTPVAYSES